MTQLPSILSSISEQLTRFTKQTEGWFLSLTSNTPDFQNKYLQLILDKLSKKQGKISKLQHTCKKWIAKFQGYSLIKCLILIWQVIRKGPIGNADIILEWISIVEMIRSSNKHANQIIKELSACICQKLQLMLNIHHIFSPTFYIHSLIEFQTLTHKDFTMMLHYNQRLVQSLSILSHFKEFGLLSRAWIIYCDQIYELISTSLMAAMCLLRDCKDGRDIAMKREELDSIDFTALLAGIASLSHKFYHHPIYSIERDPLQYKQELMLDQFSIEISSIQVFYRGFGRYKGIQVPKCYTHAKQKQKQFMSLKVIQKRQVLIHHQNGSKVDQNNENLQKAFKIKEVKTEKHIQNASKKQNADFSYFDNFSNQNNSSVKSKQKSLEETKITPLKSNVNKIIKPKTSFQHHKFQQQLMNSDINTFQWLKNLQVNGGLLSLLPSPQQMQKERLKDEKLKDILNDLHLFELKEAIRKNRTLIIDFNSIKFDKKLGSGAAGQVFAGSFNNQQIAIKKVKLQSNPNALKQFQRELLTHLKTRGLPFLLSLIGFTHHQGNFYLLTELCSQGSLFEVLHMKANQIPLNWKERIGIALQIAKGMLGLHSLKPIVIHRDLKSLNVFMRKGQNGEWQVRVADFGLARSPDSQLMTSALGTLHWMAPELLANQQYSQKVDVYSFAVVLWQLCARRTPYHDLPSPMHIVKHVLVEKGRPKLNLVSEGCPQQIMQLMEKGWNTNATERPVFTQIVSILEQSLIKLE